MTTRLLPLLLFTSLAALATAQPAASGVAPFTDASAWRVHNRQVLPVPGRPEAVRLDARARDGVLWLVGSSFGEGAIEVDVRGADQPGQSFVGVAFHGVNDTTYEAVYFRPFNFRNPDVPRRSRAVQYISHPAHPWQKLREQHPGKYEAAISPVPDPDGWFHARVEIKGREVRVFVNGAAEPCLTVTSLSDRPRGMIGLWVGHESAGEFANLKLMPAGG
jgi:hypothetical protein